MTKTAELVSKYLDGYEIVVSGGPIYWGRPDGRWPVLYCPRYRSDPRPFMSISSGYRYSGGDLEALVTPVVAKQAANELAKLGQELGV